LYLPTGQLVELEIAALVSEVEMSVMGPLAHAYLVCLARSGYAGGTEKKMAGGSPTTPWERPVGGDNIPADNIESAAAAGFTPGDPSRSPASELTI
jgi:hypothetical protein